MTQVDNLYDFFKRKSTYKGSRKGDRGIYDQKVKLEKLLKSAPNSYDIKINGKKDRALIQDIYQNEQLVRGKHMIVRHDTKIGIGDYITWDNNPYLVLYKEDETVKSKQGVKIQACDNVLTWNLNDEIVQLPVITEDKTSPFSDGTNKTGGVIIRPSDQISALIQENELSNQLKLNQRFIFDNSKLKVFRLTRIKALPSEGLYDLVLKKDGYNEYLDNLKLNLADYYEDKNIAPPVNPYIIGDDDISSFDDFGVYTLKNYNATEKIEWTITGNNASLNQIENINVEVCILDTKKYETYTLSAKIGDKTIASKKINSTYM